MTCVDLATYQAAVLACNALSPTVKGLGAPNYVRSGQFRQPAPRRNAAGVRGFGNIFSSVTSAVNTVNNDANSVNNDINNAANTATSYENTATSYANDATNAPSNLLNLATQTATNYASSYDPCTIAQGTPCPQGDGSLVCPAGTTKSCILRPPGSTAPQQCNCLNKVTPSSSASSTTSSSTTPMTATMTPGSSSSTTPMTTTMTATGPSASTGGSSQLGLLALVAVAGIGYYMYTKKKKAS